MKSNKAIVKVLSPKKDEEGPVAAHMREILAELGEDPSREGLLSTPLRAEKALKYLTSGYTTDLKKIVNGALFKESSDGMVIVRDIEFFSMCEHHLLPFYGKVHVAYLPHGKVIGLSKIPRIVDAFARRLQLQERLTTQIAGAIQEILEPRRCRRHRRGPPLLHDDAPASRSSTREPSPAPCWATSARARKPATSSSPWYDRRVNRSSTPWPGVVGGLRLTSEHDVPRGGVTGGGAPAFG